MSPVPFHKPIFVVAAFGALSSTPCVSQAQTAPLTLQQLEAQVGGPTLINYTGNVVRPAEVAKVITDALGQKPVEQQIFASETLPPAISVFWKNVPFWTAAREFEDQTGLVWTGWFGRSLDLERDNGKDAYKTNGVLVLDTTLVKVAALSTDYSSERSQKLLTDGTENSQDRSYATIDLGVYFDPKLNVEMGSVRVRNIVTSLDPKPEKKLSPRPFFPRERKNFPVSRVSFSFPANVKPGDVVQRISATLRADMMVEAETWQIPDIRQTKSIKKTIGGIEFGFEGVKQDGDTIVATVTALRDAPPETEDSKKMALMSYGWMPVTFQFKDVQGRPLGAGVYRTSAAPAPAGKQKARSDIRLRVKDGAEKLIEPYALEWIIPTKLAQLEFPIELHDVKVP